MGKPALDVITHPDLRALLVRTDSIDPLQYHEVSFADGRVGNAQLTMIHDIGRALTMQDITYLKEMDRVRSEFVHTVSHDLRSPLTSVIGYTELVERAGTLNDLRIPPGNRLEALKGGRAGQYSIRINDQYRIVFRFERSDARDVQIVDYH